MSDPVKRWRSGAAVSRARRAGVFCLVEGGLQGEEENDGAAGDGQAQEEAGRSQLRT
ncbi:hypothetical protein OVY01_20835 [Robbsia sp. Bb-Pol-6]|uniref:Uncharacterized protein n=1 Tax=Robbsia betulipollinis TaxID=2981849 RepID=A0ABT3ZSQ5_9BURK|nr:hypothetical protein [Robbsia betulipollinis]MCY0389596.1 hypothetical protein [Robbsia betulipollinis]